MGISENAVIADFGCGYGEYSISASKFLKNGKVYAIDSDKNAIKIVKNKIENYGINNIELILNETGFKIPLENNFIDVLLFYDMIHGNDLKTKRIFVGNPFSGYYVGVKERSGKWTEVWFEELKLGEINHDTFQIQVNMLDCTAWKS